MEVLVHQHDDILPIGRVHDAAVVAAGIHAAALAGHPEQFRGTGLIAVQIIRREVLGQHGVVVLLAQNAQHLRAGRLAHQLSFGYAGQQGGVIPGRGGAQLVIAVKVQGIVQDGMGKAQLPDAGVDGVQPQVIDEHIRGNVV